MIRESLTAQNRAPNWIALTGAAVALLAIPVAHAALPALKGKPLPPAAAAPAEEAVPAPEPTPAPAVLSAYSFGRPVDGYEVISPFGLRQLPWEEHGRMHEGVDIAAPEGLPVHAVAYGVVTRTGVDGGYGRFVEIRHATGLVSFYAHLGRVDRTTRPGVAVRPGTEIARIGNTGSSTGSHLHFEIRDRRGRPLNPVQFIDHQFASAADLPLRAAARIPHQVRVAFVSVIPKSKREQMAAREAEKQEALLARQEARRQKVEARLMAMTVTRLPAPAATAAMAASSATAPIVQVGDASGRVHGSVDLAG